MRVNVKLFANLGKTQFQETKVVNLHSGDTVRDLLQKLMIDLADVGILIINTKNATFDQVLTGSDNVTIIPPIGGG